MLVSYLLVSHAGQLNILQVCLFPLLVKRVQNIDGIRTFRHVHDPPFSKQMYADLLHPFPYGMHGLLVAGFETTLNSIELKACCLAHFHGKIAQVIKA